MQWYLLAVVIASVLGSLHCVGMCGPLALWASGAADPGRPRIAMATLAYHIGRGTSYLAVGLVAGWLGGLLDVGGGWLGVQQTAARLAGGLMIVAGLYQLSRVAPLRRAVSRWWTIMEWTRPRNDSTPAKFSLSNAPPQDGKASNRASISSWVTSAIVSLRPYVFRLPLIVRGAAVGLLTALLPCGWLYLFAVVALSAGTAWGGATIMLAFWVGTVPALVAAVAGFRMIAQPLRALAPTAVGVLLIVSGVTTFAGGGWAGHDQLERLRARLEQTEKTDEPDAALANRVAGGPETEESACPMCRAEVTGDRSSVLEAQSDALREAGAGRAGRSLWQQVRKLLGMPLPCCEQSAVNGDAATESTRGTEQSEQSPGSQE